MELLEFYKGKKVLLTGHTGFKGAWLTEILRLAGAEVTGYSLTPPTDPSLFQVLGLAEAMGEHHIVGDVRNLTQLKEVFDRVQPEIVLIWQPSPLCGNPTGNRCIPMKPM